MQQTTPIFTKTFDFVTWLLAATNHFPRSQRFVVTKRLLDAALNFQELLVDANACRGRDRLRRLDLADASSPHPHPLSQIWERGEGRGSGPGE